MATEPPKKEKPTHAPMTQFPVIDNCLYIAGKSIQELAQDIGGTPFYAYDKQIITDNFNRLRTALPDPIKIHYAIKANPMPEVVHHLASLTDGLDVASAGELDLALRTGINPEEISFAGPGKSNAELETAIKSGIIINLESENELDRIAAIGEKIVCTPVISVRVNPDFQLKTSGMTMGGGPKPFGVDAEKVPQILQRIGSLNLDFRGFHIFSGSQNLHPLSIIKTFTQTFELAATLAQHAPSPIKWLNIGGGLGIPYFPGEKHLELAPIGESLGKLLEQYQSVFSDAEIVIELGRYLVGECGIYVSEIVDIKESRGTTFAITNGGMHHHLAVSGNFGQVIRKNYPVCIGNRVNSDNKQIINVVGPLCTPLDILAEKYLLPKPEIGDLFVVFQSGAYGYSSSPTHFLSHRAPEQVLI